MSKPVVEFDNVSLSYRRSKVRIRSLKMYAVETLRKRIAFEDFYALTNVSFQIEPGEAVSIVGKNGAGKSSLLKLLAKVMPPTSGRVIVRGNVAPMIELGAGFHPELTGAENILLYSALLGRDTKLTRNKIYEIAEWAEVTDALNTPLAGFSNGMVARLAFATATAFPSDLLLVDEILSVGDADFRIRSQQRTKELINAGTAVVLVTHELELAKQISNRTIILDHGHLIDAGETNKMIHTYLEKFTN